MSSSTLKRRLSPMDAFFLFSEREEEPMNVGCVAQFDGRVPFKRFVSHIDSRLHLIPRYRQRVVPAPFNIGMPTWEFDPDFDINNHVHLITCDDPGDEKAFHALCSELFRGMLDRNRPLWEIYVVEGMKGNRTGMFARVHHCMIDGVAGIGLLYVIFDAWPKSEKIKKEKYLPPPIPNSGQLLYDALRDNATDAVDHWSRFRKGLVDYAKGLDPTQTKAAAKEFAATMRDFLAPAKRMPFNKPFSGERKLAFADFSFAEARAIRAACGGTLNDVVLTVLSGACQRYLQLHGESLRKRYLRVLVPVNIRTEDERGDMGNRISFLPLEVPLEVKDPVERLRIINENTTELKKSRVSEAVSLMFSALQGVPAPVQALSLGSVATPLVQKILGMAWQVPPMHLICTNVPGPQIPLYCVGKRLLSYYPLLPIALEMGISCGVTSYDQRLFVSLIADGNAAPDVDSLIEFVRESFLELRAAASVNERHVVEMRHAMRDQEEHENRGNGTGNPAVKRKPRALKKQAISTADSRMATNEITESN
ncbi:MAG: wax ester/triacylglycerol synthase family O-acyltransferase [Candidatus Hydrogenedentes bacterium]|nr:wax ester/triacylglycerol synthase family O-acyltransferase [Candidatus Hydrogenedentota bacterium]